MPLNFAKKGVAAGAPKDEAGSPGTQAAKGPGATSSPSPQSQQNKSTQPPKQPQQKGGLSFIKKGAAAKAAIAEDEAKAEMAKAEQGKMYRYRILENEEGSITFLDGELDGDGLLDVPIVHEHMVKLNGTWHNFVCTAEVEGYCPVCDGGDSKPYIAGLLTVIDHKPYTPTSGKNAGKTYVNRRKLYVAKKETLKLLTKKAQKHGGLTGCTFEVSRSGDKSASVGSALDFVSKASLADIRSKYDLKDEDVAPAEYDKELVYRTPEDLIELGVGKAKSGIGYSNGASKQAMKDAI